ncbi:hypothetical protein AX768_25255 [Burkholderia sp. PAMC 28687]|uniref:hypothetical protein n=1 Tax=Burkholderia sp. PAMC 28687 TaxID=1795874 RepID=UPI0007828340|nr:hypothetical protein [Burkholderia sp. PAMC 28687]AMM17510.1 hypothetical protein AX768_25255 [Burkholderia sp. PAMC 28687]
MAAETDIIREFLVSLGFKIDKVGLESFVKGITAASAAVFASVTAIEDNLEKLYFASQRTKASAENIRAFGFSMSQMGSSAGAALDTIENLARFMRNSPGANGLIQSLGVQTQGANGQLRDTSLILQDLGKQFANMPYYRANAYAQALGIDEKTLMALRQGLGDFGDDYKQMLAAAGLDLEGATKRSHEFMVQTRTLGSAFVILGQKIADSMSARLSGGIKKFREGLVDNFDKITDVIAKVISGVLWLADTISTLALRAMQAIGTIVDWFNSFDDSTKKVLIGLGLLIGGWKLLNAVFLSTPLGRLALLATALLALYDDYRVWKEGGKSLIDWSIWESQIDKAMFGLSKLGNMLRALGKMAQDAWRGNWSALPADWEEAKAALAAKDVGGGNAQAQIDAYKTDGGVKLSRGAQARVDAANASNDEEFGTIIEVPDASQPRGIRNNNPGNLNFVGQEGATLEAHPNARFARFRTPEEGLAALASQLRRYGERGLNTASAIINKYAPRSENRDSFDAYVNRLSSSVGVGADGKIDLSNPDQLNHVMGAVIQMENGRNPYSREQLAAASGVGAAGAPGSNPVSISQSTTIHVAGGSNPEAAGQAVAGQQDGVNQRLVRNMRSAVQ